MKTELQIANERILELENQVKKLSTNLPVCRSLPIGQYRHCLISLRSRINEAQRTQMKNEVDYHLGLAVKMIDGELFLYPEKEMGNGG